MSEMHTPGPWTAHPREDAPVDLFTPEWYCIEGPGSDVYGHMTASDAHLIAAAPELLDALHGLLKEVNVRIDDPRIRLFDAGRAAILKARGGAA